MAFTHFNILQALSVLHTATEEGAREEAQSFLLKVQRSPHLTWPILSHWLASTVQLNI